MGACGEGADRGVADDGRLARARLDEDDGQGVQIGAPVDRRAAGLLGRDVARGADERARRLRPRGLGQRAGEAEVGDAHDPVRVEQEVPGLDVAVDDAAAMGVRERGAHLPADVRRLLGREALAGVEHGSQRAALQELEHHERDAVVLAPVVHGHDVGVVQRCGHLGLGPEPAQEPAVVGEGPVQDLDRDPRAAAGRRRRGTRGRWPRHRWAPAAGTDR